MGAYIHTLYPRRSEREQEKKCALNCERAGMAHVGLHGRPEWVGVAGAERIREKGNSVFVCVDRVCVLDGEDNCVLER